MKICVFEKNGRWKQRYEYVLTSDGVEYAELIASEYQNELTIIENYLILNKHSIQGHGVCCIWKVWKINKNRARKIAWRRFLDGFIYLQKLWILYNFRR